MRIFRLLLLSGLAVALTACGKEPAESAAAAITLEEANTIALVDGSPITIADRALHIQQRQKQGKSTDFDDITQELINLKVIVNNAVKAGLLDRKDVKAELQRQSDALLANIYIREIIQSIEITDSDLANEYKQQIAQMSTREYSASHILLDSESAALAVIERLDGGAEFGRVASETSIGPSAENGGELGWFRPESMAPKFSAAVAELEPGEYTKHAVKTSFGWHVIRLTDTREVENPALDQIKEQIRNTMLNRRLNEFVQGLRSKATIEIKQP